MAYDAMKMESDATIQELRDQKAQQATMGERLYTARDILEKERNELQASLSKKMKETLRLEEELREYKVHNTRKKNDQSNFNGLLRAFDLHDDDEIIVKKASKQTQTDNHIQLNLGMPMTMKEQMRAKA